MSSLSVLAAFGALWQHACCFSRKGKINFSAEIFFYAPSHQGVKRKYITPSRAQSLALDILLFFNKLNKLHQLLHELPAVVGEQDALIVDPHLNTLVAVKRL